MKNKQVGNMKNLVRLIILISSLFIILGCSGDESQTTDSETKSSGDSNYIITLPDYKFTLDHAKETGWKSSKTFDPSAVDEEGNLYTPGAIEIHYGFRQRKDVEIRFYESHEDALNLGAPVAAAATENLQETGGAQSVTTLADAGVGVRGGTKYAAYGVIGNLVVLCELSVETCESFSDALLIANPSPFTSGEGEAKGLKGSGN